MSFYAITDERHGVDSMRIKILLFTLTILSFVFVEIPVVEGQGIVPYNGAQCDEVQLVFILDPSLIAQSPIQQHVANNVIRILQYLSWYHQYFAPGMQISYSILLAQPSGISAYSLSPNAPVPEAYWMRLPRFQPQTLIVNNQPDDVIATYLRNLEPLIAEPFEGMQRTSAYPSLDRLPSAINDLAMNMGSNTSRALFYVGSGGLHEGAERMEEIFEGVSSRFTPHQAYFVGTTGDVGAVLEDWSMGAGFERDHVHLPRMSTGEDNLLFNQYVYSVILSELNQILASACGSSTLVGDAQPQLNEPIALESGRTFGTSTADTYWHFAVPSGQAVLRVATAYNLFVSARGLNSVQLWYEDGTAGVRHQIQPATTTPNNNAAVVRSLPPANPSALHVLEVRNPPAGDYYVVRDRVDAYDDPIQRSSLYGEQAIQVRMEGYTEQTHPMILYGHQGEAFEVAGQLMAFQHQELQIRMDFPNGPPNIDPITGNELQLQAQVSYTLIDGITRHNSPVQPTIVPLSQIGGNGSPGISYVVRFIAAVPWSNLDTPTVELRDIVVSLGYSYGNVTVNIGEFNLNNGVRTLLVIHGVTADVAQSECSAQNNTGVMINLRLRPFNPLYNTHFQSISWETHLLFLTSVGDRPLTLSVAERRNDPDGSIILFAQVLTNPQVTSLSIEPQYQNVGGGGSTPMVLPPASQLACIYPPYTLVPGTLPTGAGSS